jgi:hypothetical protein
MTPGRHASVLGTLSADAEHGDRLGSADRRPGSDHDAVVDDRPPQLGARADDGSG